MDLALLLCRIQWFRQVYEIGGAFLDTKLIHLFHSNLKKWPACFFPYCTRLHPALAGAVNSFAIQWLKSLTRALGF